MSEERLERIEATQTRLVNDVGEMKGLMRQLVDQADSIRELSMTVADHGSRISTMEATSTEQRGASRTHMWNVITTLIAVGALAVAIWKG